MPPFLLLKEKDFLRVFSLSYSVIPQIFLMHTFIGVLRPPEPSTTNQVGLKKPKHIALQLWRREL